MVAQEVMMWEVHVNAVSFSFVQKHWDWSTYCLCANQFVE